MDAIDTDHLRRECNRVLLGAGYRPLLPVKIEMAGVKVYNKAWPPNARTVFGGPLKASATATFPSSILRLQDYNTTRWLGHQVTKEERAMVRIGVTSVDIVESDFPHPHIIVSIEINYIL